MKKLSFLTLLITAALACASCAKDYTLVGTEREQGGDPIWLSTSVTVQNTRAAGAVAQNIPVSATETDMDNKVYSLRMIISDSKTGDIVYNERTDKPEEVEAKYNQTAGATAMWKKPIKIIPGTYDFWFIANEGVNWFSPTESNSGRRDHFSELSTQVWDKLTVGSNIARIFDGKVFTGADAGYAPLSHLDIVPYRKYAGREKNPIWTPIVGDVDYKKNELWGSWSLNRPMPMSAVYKDVYIASTRNGKGTTEQDPQHFIADGDEMVKLVRCMAKVTIIVKNAAYVNSNKTVRNLQWPVLDKFAITLLNRPRYWSFFNTPLFDMNHKPREFKYYSDIFPDDQSRYRAYAISVGGDRTPESYNGVPYTAGSRYESDLKDYQYTFYVPELLLEKNPLDGDPSKGEQAFDRTNALMLAFSTPNRGFWGRSDFFTQHPGAAENVNFYPYGSKAEFEGKVDESKAFNIGTPDLEEVNDHESPNSPKLLNPDRYSKFSLLRNRHYVITIREKDRLQVDAVIAPWNEAPKSKTMLLDEVMVNMPDPSFSATNKQMTLRIQNGFATHLYSKIRISLLNQNGGENSQAFFSNIGTMKAVKRNGQRVVQVEFGGTNTAHTAAHGFSDFTIDWSATTGANTPTPGKAFIKLEYFDANNQKVTYLNHTDNTIVVSDRNWTDAFKVFEEDDRRNRQP